jgi:hypothetical protein
MTGGARGEGREILGGGGGGAAGPLWAQSGDARGGGWAKNGEGGEEREERIFLFFLKSIFLDECIYIFKQSKRMHGSAWCIKQNKIF